MADPPTEEEFLALSLLNLSRGGGGLPPHPPTLHLPYSCVVCNKSFPSYQALGGHKSTHKKPFPAEPSSAREKIPSAAAVSGQKHKCSICHKIFSTGQALGGHKRRHYDGGSRRGSSSASLSKGGGPIVRPIERDFDLNLPVLPEFSYVERYKKCESEGLGEEEAECPLPLKKAKLL